MNMPEEKIISKDSAQSSPHQMIVLNAITADLFKAQNGALTYYDAKIGKKLGSQKKIPHWILLK